MGFLGHLSISEPSHMDAPSNAPMLKCSPQNMEREAKQNYESIASFGSSQLNEPMVNDSILWPKRRAQKASLQAILYSSFRLEQPKLGSFLHGFKKRWMCREPTSFE